MIARPYPVYKDSGIGWVPRVPSDWEITRIKTRISLVTEKAAEKTNPVALEHIESGSGRLLHTDGTFDADGIKFRRGDILFGKLRPYLAKSWLADNPGEAVGDFLVLRPRRGVYARFFHYITLSPEFIQTVNGSTFGSKMPRASWDFIGNMPCPFPDLDTQQKVAVFLDRETSRLDMLIRKQERLIELLAEKRQAIITQAVTKGLDPSAATKPSDIPFMGDIPATWKVSRLGTWILRNIEGGYSPSASNEYPEDGEWGVLALGAVGRAHFFGGKVKGVDLDVEVPKNLAVRQGDILLTRSNVRDRVGFAAVVDRARPLTIFPDLIYRLHVSDSVNADYLVLFLSSQPARAEIMSNARGSSDTMPKISHDQIRSWQIPLPPVTMQREIVSHVQKDLSRTDELSRRAASVIELLKERRSALISAAVTGKIDVREGAT